MTGRESFLLTHTPYRFMRWFSIAALAAAFPGLILLPPQWGLENGLLEWLEVVLLAGNLGLAILLGLAWRTSDPPRARFWWWAVPLWAIAIGRELSWGKVFLQGASGAPVSPAWYRPVVYPLLAAIVLAWLAAALRHGFHREVARMAAGRNLPLPAMLATALALISAILAERHIVPIHAERVLLAEELFEAALYLCLAAVMLGLGRRPKRAPAGQSRSD